MLYTDATGAALFLGVTASNASTTLTLSHATDVPEGSYWVTATETGYLESARLQLTVNAYPYTETPMVSSAGVGKTTESQSRAEFTLTNLTNTYTTFTTWRVYPLESSTTVSTIAIVEVTSQTLALVRIGPGGIPDRAYWVTAQEPGKFESSRLKLTVAPRRQPQPRCFPLPLLQRLPQPSKV